MNAPLRRVSRRRTTLNRPTTVLVLVRLLAFVADSFGQVYELSNNQVTALNPAAFAPSFVMGGLDRWIPGIDLPWELRYGIYPLNSLGFLLNGQWQKGLILGGIDAVAVTGAWLARPSFPLSSFTGMPASHLSMYTQYELYRGSRTMADPSSSRYEWRPVDVARAAMAPFRFGYLADPFVSLFLLGEIVGAWAVNHFANGPFETPTDPFVWHGNAHPRVGGIALYLAELACRFYWAGVAEEAEFRGFLLPEMTEPVTPLFDYDTSMDLGRFMLNALHRFIPTGIYLSYLSYREDFDFRKAAFAHFWYDFSLGLLYLFYGDSVQGASMGDLRTTSTGKGMSFSFSVSLR